MLSGIIPFTNMDQLKSHQRYEIASFIKYGTEYLSILRNSKLAPLMFGNGYSILSHTLQGMWLLIYTEIVDVKPS